MPLSTYTSNDADFPSHESHEITPRPFMTSEMGSILVATTLDCKLDVVATGARLYSCKTIGDEEEDFSSC
jgi:hypothetical protein